MREEELWVVARAEVEAVDAVDAGGSERAFRYRPQVELPAARQVGIEPVGDLGTDLVAAGADRRADHRRLLAGAEGCHARLDDAFGQPTPAGVENRKPRRLAARARDGDR